MQSTAASSPNVPVTRTNGISFFCCCSDSSASSPVQFGRRKSARITSYSVSRRPAANSSGVATTSARNRNPAFCNSRWMNSASAAECSTIRTRRDSVKPWEWAAGGWNAVRLMSGDLQRGFRQNKRKLLTTVTAGNVFLPCSTLHEVAQLAEHSVARLVAQAVVEALEVVEVEHDQPQAAPTARQAVQLALERLLHVAPVEQAGQGIADGLGAQILTQFQVRQSQRRVFGDSQGQP